MNLSDLINEDVELQQDDWSTSGQKFGEEGQLELVGLIRKGNNKYYIFKCSICSEDKEMFGEGYFKTTKEAVVSKERLPCGCTTKRKVLTKHQLEVKLRRICKNGPLNFIRMVDNVDSCAPKAIVSCGKCGKEFKIHTSSIVSGRQQGCFDCNKLPQRKRLTALAKERAITEQDAIIRINNELGSKKSNLRFIEFTEPFHGLKTKMNIECTLHGQLNIKPKLATLLHSNWLFSCDGCMEEIEKKNLESSGFFPAGTTFRFAGHRVRGGKKTLFWEINCPVYGESAEGVLWLLKRGYIPCKCKNTPPKTEAYINLVWDTNINTFPIMIKFGISHKSLDRARRQDTMSIYRIENHLIFYFNSEKDCKAAELECRQTLECGLASKEEMLDGFSETTHLSNMEKVIRIYEKYGGKIKYDEQ